MGYYEQRIVPRIINTACGDKNLRPLRERTCAGLSGEVVEVGFGTGLNVPYSPGSVKQVAAVDPSDLGWKLASTRLAESDVPIERSGLDGQREQGCKIHVTRCTCCHPIRAIHCLGWLDRGFLSGILQDSGSSAFRRVVR